MAWIGLIHRIFLLFTFLKMLNDANMWWILCVLKTWFPVHNTTHLNRPPFTIKFQQKYHKSKACSSVSTLSCQDLWDFLGRWLSCLALSASRCFRLFIHFTLLNLLFILINWSRYSLLSLLPITKTSWPMRRRVFSLRGNRNVNIIAIRFTWWRFQLKQRPSWNAEIRYSITRASPHKCQSRTEDSFRLFFIIKEVSTSFIEGDKLSKRKGNNVSNILLESTLVVLK